MSKNKKYLSFSTRKIACYPLFVFLCTTFNTTIHTMSASDSPDKPKLLEVIAEQEEERRVDSIDSESLELSTLKEKDSPVSEKKTSRPRQISLSNPVALSERKLSKISLSDAKEPGKEDDFSRAESSRSIVTSDSSIDDWEVKTPRPESTEQKTLERLLTTIQSSDVAQVETFLNNPLETKDLTFYSIRQGFRQAVERSYLLIIECLIKHPICAKALTDRFLSDELSHAIKQKNGLLLFSILSSHCSFEKQPEIIQTIFKQALEANDNELIAEMVNCLQEGIALGKSFARMPYIQGHKITIQTWEEQFKPHLKKARINDDCIMHKLATEQAKGEEKEYLTLCSFLGDQVTFFSDYFRYLLSIKIQSDYLDKITNVFKNKQFKTYLIPLIHYHRSIQLLLDQLFLKIFTQKKSDVDDVDVEKIYRAVEVFFQDEIYTYLNKESIRQTCSKGPDRIKTLLKKRLEKLITPATQLPEEKIAIVFPEIDDGSTATTISQAPSTRHSSAPSSRRSSQTSSAHNTPLSCTSRRISQPHSATQSEEPEGCQCPHCTIL